MNKCIVKKRFVCGVEYYKNSTWFYDHECDKSGIKKGDGSPCQYRSLKLDGIYDCTCPSAIFEKLSDKQSCVEKMSDK